MRLSEIKKIVAKLKAEAKGAHDLSLIATYAVHLRAGKTDFYHTELNRLRKFKLCT